MNKHIAILSVEHLYERTAFRVLFAVLGILLCSYLYFVGSSVLNIIARKEATRASASLQGAISQLEKEYFVLTESVTPASAESIGLAPIGTTLYVYRPGNAAVAPGSLGTIERDAI